jgi:plasmid stabilization system protein ParE
MQVRFADAALTDIENIRTYISPDNSPAASTIAAAIVAAADRLSVNPRLGRLGAMPGAFELIVRPYVLVDEIHRAENRGAARLARTATAAEDLTDVYTPTWRRDPASLGRPLGPARPQRTFLAPTRRVKPLLGQMLFKARSC